MIRTLCKLHEVSEKQGASFCQGNVTCGIWAAQEFCTSNSWDLPTWKPLLRYIIQRTLHRKSWWHLSHVTQICIYECAMTVWPGCSASRHDPWNEVEANPTSPLRPPLSPKNRGASCFDNQICWWPHIVKVGQDARQQILGLPHWTSYTQLT